MSSPESPRPRLLVVDDDPAIQLVLARALARFGYQVLLAESGAHALAQLDAEADIVAVLSDVDMAPMTGLQLVEQIHLLRPGVPILFITGNPGAVDLKRHPGVAVVIKPIDLTELRNAVYTVIHGLQWPTPAP